MVNIIVFGYWKGSTVTFRRMNNPTMDREELLLLAKFAEQCERYEVSEENRCFHVVVVKNLDLNGNASGNVQEEPPTIDRAPTPYDHMIIDGRLAYMVEAMKKITNMGGALTDEERNLMSVAYKNVVGSRRSAWRIVNAITSKEPEPHEVHKTYISEIETELKSVCDEVLKMLEGVIAEAEKLDLTESLIFYHKMRGDYLRYLAEINTNDSRKSITEKALDAYTKSSQKAAALPPTHPIALGLALNFSVFYYEILNMPSKARELAKKAFNDAIAKLDSLKEDSYQDSTLILQLLKDNLTLWTSESEDKE